MKKNTLTIKKLSIIVLLLSALILSVVLVIPEKDASAKLMRTTAGQYDYIFSYIIDATKEDANATDITITAQTIDKDIVIPEFFEDEYGKHYVTSIGDSGISEKDSFFYQCDIATDADDIEISINVDMRACSKLETINAYAFYEAPLRKVELPEGLKTVGKKAFAACSSSSIRVANPNTFFLGSYDADYLYKAVGMEYSCMRDFMGDAAAKKYTGNGINTAKLTLSYDMALIKNLAERSLQTYVYVPTDQSLAYLATLMALPECESHDFQGYYTGQNGTGTKYYDKAGNLLVTSTTDITLYAYMTPKVFNINYHGAEEYSTATRTYGNSLTLPVPTKTGYIFDGWYTTEDFQTGTMISEIGASETGNLELYAKWTPITYSIIFHGNGATGNTAGITNIAYDSTTKLTTNGYVMTGYHFKEWNTKSNGTGTSYKNQEEVKNLRTTSGDVTLYAIWETDSNTPYTVTYVYRGLTSTTDERTVMKFSGTTGSTITPDPSKGARTGFVTPKKNTLVITADGKSNLIYTFEREIHTVTAEPGNGVSKVAGTGTYRYGETVTIVSTAKAGYHLNDISLVTDSKTETKKIDGCTFVIGTENVTVKVTATPDTDIPYTVRHVYKGLKNDDEIKTETFAGTTDNTVTPDTIQKEGFVSPEKQSSAVDGSGNTIITYIYERETHSVSVEKGTGILKVTGEGTYRYGETVTVTSTTKDGYEANGFERDGYLHSDINGKNTYTLTIGTEKVTLKAVAKPLTYTITYELFDGKMTGTAPVEYTHGQKVPLPNASVMNKPCEEFLGWFTDQNCEGEPVTEIKESDCGNKIFYAGWGPSDYTVSFDTQGGTINSGIFDTYMYGIGATLPTDVTKNGYTFLGWKCNDIMTTAIGTEEYGRKNFVAVWRDNADSGVEDIVEEENVEKIIYIAPVQKSFGEYYYTQLNATEKNIYDTLYSIYKFDTSKGDDQTYDSITLCAKTLFTEKNVANAQAALVWDHPEIFWVRYFGKSNVWQNGNEYFCSICPKKAYDENSYRAEMQNYQKNINYAKKIEIGISSKDNDYIKIKKIHDYIATHYKYDDFGTTLSKKTSDDTRSVGHMLLNRSGCCEAYAKLMKVLCKEYGIECILVSSQNHMWNQIKLNGKWYGLDVTWNDTPKKTVYTYFLKGKSVFAKDKEHTVANAFYVKKDGTLETTYGCFKVPTLSSDYTTKKTSSYSKCKTIKKGTLITSGNLVYTVTKISGKTGTVSVKRTVKKTASSITIPASIKKNGTTFKVTAICTKAFKGMKKVKKATIGKNITSIGGSTFASDKKLKKIIFKGKKVKKVGNKAIKGIHKKAIIKVPKSKRAAYKKLLKKKGLKSTMKVK